MQRRFADPAFRAWQVRAMGKGLQQALQQDPALRERLRAHGRRIGTANKGSLTQPAGGPRRQRAARAQSEFYLGWCPIEYRDSYRRLVRSCGISAADARRMTEDLIATDATRYHANGELPQTTRLAMGQGDEAMTDRRWKVTVISLFPNDNQIETVYGGANADEEAACDAALTKTAVGKGGSTIDRIEEVEEIG